MQFWRCKVYSSSWLWLGWYSLERNNEEGEVVAGGSTVSLQRTCSYTISDHLFAKAKSDMDDGAYVVKTSNSWGLSVEFGKHLYGVEAAAQYLKVLKT